MLSNKILQASARQAGFTLIELMIAVVLGLIITAAVTAMTVNNLKMSGDTLKSARLNQDLGAVMQIMVNDIRRAGYNYCDKENFHCYDTQCEHCTDGVCNHPPETNRVCYGTDSTPEDVSINDAGSCILYHYNQDDDGQVTNDNYGFRRVVANGVGILQMADNTGTVACDPDDNNHWQSLTDPAVIDVTVFTLNTVNSKCGNEDKIIRISPVETETGLTIFACNETSDEKLQEWDVDDQSWEDLDGNLGVAMSSSGKTTVGVRHVNISLEAQLANDSSVSKNLDVSIKVRNDHVYN